jgi:hypothetical protein
MFPIEQQSLTTCLIIAFFFGPLHTTALSSLFSKNLIRNDNDLHIFSTCNKTKVAGFVKEIRKNMDSFCESMDSYRIVDHES